MRYGTAYKSKFRLRAWTLDGENNTTAFGYGCDTDRTVQVSKLQGISGAPVAATKCSNFE